MRQQAAMELKNNQDGGKVLAHRIGRSSVASMSSLSALSTSSVMGVPPPPPPSSSAATTRGQFLEPMPPPGSQSGAISGPGSLNESAVEPLDYEEYVNHQMRLNRGQNNKQSGAVDNLLVDFPPDDIEVNVVSRKIRTLGHVLPEEPM